MFGIFWGPPGAGNGPKMCPRGPALEPRSIVRIRPMAARLVAKIHFEKIPRAMYFWSQLFKPEGTRKLVGRIFKKKTLPSLNTWLQKYMALGFFSKCPFAPNRAAIGRIRTILWGSRAGPRGHLLVLFLAPGGPKDGPKKPSACLRKALFPTSLYQRVADYGCGGRAAPGAPPRCL